MEKNSAKFCEIIKDISPLIEKADKSKTEYFEESDTLCSLYQSKRNSVPLSPEYLICSQKSNSENIIFVELEKPEKITYSTLVHTEGMLHYFKSNYTS